MITRKSKRTGKYTPILPHLLLYMLTGVRRAERLELKWKDVDLESGIIRVKSPKTQKIRIIPLVGDIHCEISPTFLEILRTWHEKLKIRIFYRIRTLKNL